MGIVDLEFEALGVDQVIRDLQATETQVRQALRSTLRKMASWMRTRSVRGLSEHLQIQQKVIRRRLRTFRMRTSPDGGTITVWYGLNPISLIYLGARQNKAGVTAGAHQRPGAFIASGKGGNQQVFKRRGSARLPLDKQRLDIQDKANTYLEDNIIGDLDFESQFYKIFEHELQWRTRTQP